jgi:5-formyltetrahydrofolate cyclo-ligase
VAGHLARLPFATSSGHVAGYWAIDGEIALHAWQMRLPAAVTYCLPVLHDDGRLRFAPWKPGEPLAANRFGIPEPDVDASDLLPGDALSLVVVPVVGFDDAGQRLGMGAGWYDRTFAGRHDAPAPPWLVGAAFAAQRVDGLDGRSWDVPMDAVCTELGSHLFTPDPGVRPGDPSEG